MREINKTPSSQNNDHDRIILLDTDSYAIGIDNRASGSFYHVSTDYVGPLRDSNRIVKGFGGSKTSSVKIGTLKWT